MSERMTLFVYLDDLVPSNDPYRLFNKIFNFESIKSKLLEAESPANYKGYGVLRLFKCLLLQFMEDLSDRELEQYIRLNIAAKWFCDFELTEKTPDYSVFSRLRKKIGTETLADIFAILRDQLRSQGYLDNVFTFVDASHLIAKSALWEERDEAKRRKFEKLNNATLPEVAHDKDARIGCKGKNKYWYGYKKHVSVDMQSGLINKVAVTRANVTDSAGLKHVCPSGGAVYADKGYCTSQAQDIAKIKNVHLAAIKKNNMKAKNFSLDKFYSKMRAPYERVFSKQRRRVRYVGIAKNQLSEFMYAICFNLRRLVVLTTQSQC